jgi:hypothetical protein
MKHLAYFEYTADIWLHKYLNQKFDFPFILTLSGTESQGQDFLTSRNLSFSDANHTRGGGVGMGMGGSR